MRGRCVLLHKIERLCRRFALLHPEEPRTIHQSQIFFPLFCRPSLLSSVVAVPSRATGLLHRTAVSQSASAGIAVLDHLAPRPESAKKSQREGKNVTTFCILRIFRLSLGIRFLFFGCFLRYLGLLAFILGICLLFLCRFFFLVFFIICSTCNVRVRAARQSSQRRRANFQGGDALTSQQILCGTDEREDGYEY